MTTNFYKIQKDTEKGFTLIELLIVIGILAILMGIVLIAINPARQFSQANNTKRQNDVTTILNSIGQYMSDHHGTLPAGIVADGTAHLIGTGGTESDFCSSIVPTYVAALPTDPTTGVGDGGAQGGQVTNCSSYQTNYEVSVSSASAGSRVTITAPAAELGQTISVTR